MVRLANAERGAVEGLRAKSEFIAHMSHELRTPLNAIIGFSEVIAGGIYGPPGHAKYGEYARDIAAAGRDLHDKIGDILEFANIEAGHFPLKEEAVDLAALVRACVEEQQGRAFSRRIALGLTFAEPGLVRADAQGCAPHPRQSSCQRAGLYERRRLRARRSPFRGRRRRHPADRQRHRLWRPARPRPFARYDRAGAGLGLAIAMELARRMGGAMRLESAPAAGRRWTCGCPDYDRSARRLPVVNHG